MDVDDFAWLLTDDGQRLLALAEQLLRDGVDPLRSGDVLRRSTTPARAAAASTQAALRDRAVGKFGEDAARMYFTPDALEQATRSRVAAHRAARVEAAGLESAIDLGCGIGGDLIALARVGRIVAGIDLDPVRVAIAEANLAALELPGAVSVADATAIDHRPFAMAFADPARRSGAGRTFSIEDWTPPWSLVSELLERDACVKAAPGLPHEVIPAAVEAEWVSDRGEVKEVALWGGRLATTSRRATVIGEHGLATLTSEDDPGADVGTVQEYLVEPDGAVIRAGLVTAVAAQLGGTLIDPKIAYVTTSGRPSTRFGRAYRVLEELPYRERALKAALRERSIGSLTIKKRGVEITPETLRRRLALTGDRAGTIVLTRVADQGVCYLVEPVDEG